MAVQKEGKIKDFDLVIFHIYYFVDDMSRTTGYMYLYSDVHVGSIVSGRLVLEKGKKLLFTIDDTGYQILAGALNRWLNKISLEKGFTITNPTVNFQFETPKPMKMKVDKNTGDLIKSTKFKIKGIVEAQIDYEWVQRKFKFKFKGVF